MRQSLIEQTAAKVDNGFLDLKDIPVVYGDFAIRAETERWLLMTEWIKIHTQTALYSDLTSGFVSAGFIEQEKAFYKKCEALWQKEPKDDVPSGMDADKYFCAQDWEIKNWITGPIKINFNKNDSASITYLILDSLDNQERKIECQKLNGQWLISKIECDLGQNID